MIVSLAWVLLVKRWEAQSLHDSFRTSLRDRAVFLEDRGERGCYLKALSSCSTDEGAGIRQHGAAAVSLPQQRISFGTISR